uniref:26S proteasome non-ATPase regulatory subunit 9 n=1 Tax=Corethrella appendiculata TaxID=1370023 RepID=U5ER96_9DIPT
MVVPSSSTRDEVLKLIDKRDKLDQEMKELFSVLESNHVDMNDSLVDADGYPRNDVDVYQIRNARHKIICLRNDRKALMKQIEDGLTTVHTEMREMQPKLSTPKLPVNTEETNDVEMNYASIAKINLVSSGSPADDARLQLNDEIVEFGTINSSNFKDLSQIGVLVNHSEGKRVPLKVKRADKYLDLVITPRKWSGRGLLGCNIILI